MRTTPLCIAAFLLCGCAGAPVANRQCGLTDPSWIALDARPAEADQLLALASVRDEGAASRWFRNAQGELLLCRPRATERRFESTLDPACASYHWEFHRSGDRWERVDATPAWCHR